MNYKQIVLDNCLSNNTIKPSTSIRKFFETNIGKEIIEITNFILSGTLSERIYCIVNDITKIPECHCGNQIKHYHNYTKGYAKTCSLKCNANSSEKQQKQAKTNLIKYGVTNVFQSEQTKEKIVKTKIEKYGDAKYVNRKKGTITDYQNFIKTFESDELELISSDDTYTDFFDREYKCKKCSTIFKPEQWQKQMSYVRCLKCYPKFKTKGEGEIHQFLKTHNIEFKQEDRTLIYPKEVDILIESHKIAIEYNGLLWHSFGMHNTSYLNNYLDEDKKYHLNKTQACESKGYQLFHIFQNEWENPVKQEIWKSIIKSKLGLNQTIYARKCMLKEIGSQESFKFLEQNHLQGNVFSDRNIALYYNNELVSLLTLSMPRFNKKYDWEITRFCNKIGFNVVGGFSKLLAYFRSKYNGSIITYADRRYSNGNMYKISGFTELSDSKPNYFYFTLKEQQLHSRIKFQKHKLKNKLDKFNSDKSESLNMFENGYRRIWDCGNKVFTLT